MANAQTTTRRDLLKAAPALTLVGAVPAAATSDEIRTMPKTPVTALFREWKAHNDWLKSDATKSIPGDEMDALCNRDMEMIEALVSTPAQSLEDLCLKLITVTEFGADISYVNLEGGDLLQREARALIGA